MLNDRAEGLLNLRAMNLTFRRFSFLDLPVIGKTVIIKILFLLFGFSVFAQPAVHSVIVGTINPVHLCDNVAVTERVLAGC